MAGLIRDEDIDEIRGRADIVEVISQHTALKQKGKLHWGLCPFHKEKTPSFKVDKATQLFHCFGCGEGGNVFTFLMKIDGLEFPEAVRTLADRVGLALQVDESPAARQAVSAATRLLAANEQAAEYYYHLLLSAEGEAGRSYLKSRGYDKEIAVAFKLGWGGEKWDGLLGHLSKAGFTSDEIQRAGLAVPGKRGLYDRFRRRVIFPVLDIKGRTVALGGRVIDESETPKYMNSPETPVYHKGRELYGLYQARREVTGSGVALVVEGYTDLISLYAAGVKNVAATLGTAFTADHLRLLARHAERVVLLFDADAAGVKAAERGMEYASDFRLPGHERIGDLTERERVDVEVAVLPEGQDPADLAAEAGPEGVAEVVAAAKPLVDFMLEQVLRRHDLTKSREKLKAAGEGLEVIAQLQSAVAQEEYTRMLADRLDVSADSLAAELAKKRDRARRGLGFRAAGGAGSAPAGGGVPGSGDVEAAGAGDGAGLGPELYELSELDIQGRTEREFLRLVLQFPSEFIVVLGGMEPDRFSVAVHRRLVEVLQGLGPAVRIDRIVSGMSNLEESARKLASGLMLEDIPAEDRKRYGKEIVVRLEDFALQRQITKLRGKLDSLAGSADTEYDSLFAELVSLEAARRKLGQ